MESFLKFYQQQGVHNFTKKKYKFELLTKLSTVSTGKADNFDYIKRYT